MKKLFTILLILIWFVGFSQAQKKPVEFNYPVLFKGGNFEIANPYKFDPAESYTDIGDNYIESDSVYKKTGFKVGVELPVLYTERFRKYKYSEDGVISSNSEEVGKLEFSLVSDALRLSNFNKNTDLINSEVSTDSVYIDYKINGIFRYDITNGINKNWQWPTDSGQLVTLSEVALQLLNEGNGTGIAIRGRNPNFYGNIGLSAVDMSKGYANSSTRGATGSNAVAFGANTTASGSYSTAFGITNIASGQNSSVLGGSGNTASGAHAVASGFDSVASGQNSFVWGNENRAQSMGEWSGGLLGTIPSGQSANSYVSTDRLFNLGNGTSGVSRSDALTVLKNGLATLPSVTNALITAESTGKAIVTREYVDSAISLIPSGYVPLAGVHPLNQITGPLLFNNASRIEDVGGNLEIHRNAGFTLFTSPVKANEDIEVAPTGSSITIPGIVLTSPNGSRWRVNISDSGVLTTTPL